MKRFELSVNGYRKHLEAQNGFASDILVQEYAKARVMHNRRLKGDFDPFTNDPGCKTCGKKAKKVEKPQD